MSPAFDEYFAPTYRTARHRLLREVENVGAAVEMHEHPGPSADDRPLYTDVVTLGSLRPRRLLLVISGTHGIEGFAGAAIQLDCLRRLRGSRLAEGALVMLVHGINPYGFAWQRRGDQNNVDLNRNLVDHPEGHTSNPDYDALHGLLCPDEWNDTTARLFAEAIGEFEARHGRRALEHVLARGQHSHPDGLFFGGRAPTWSNRLLRSLLNGVGPTLERVILLDLHTGLGSYGAAQLICGVDESSPRTAEIRAWLGDGAVFFGPASGFRRLPGAIDSAIGEAVPGVDITPITIEFGTLPPLDVLYALCADNWLHRTTPRPSLDSPIKRDMRRAFCPDDPDWREMVLVRGRQVIARALEQLRS